MPSVPLMAACFEHLNLLPRQVHRVLVCTLSCVVLSLCFVTHAATLLPLVVRDLLQRAPGAPCL